MIIENCQVCGNPIFGAADMGINTDGSLNNDYCSNCYKHGRFITGDDDLAGNNDSFLMPYAMAGAVGIPGFAGAAGTPADSGIIGAPLFISQIL